MKKLFLLVVLFCLSVSAAFAQKRKPAAASSAPKKTASTKNAPKKQSTPANATAKAKKPATAATVEISAAEWSAIIEALDKEDWTRATMFSSAALGKLKIDNERKQLARLRYFYLYALAGKAAGGLMTYAELKKIADRFLGQEFLMPSREFLADCQNKVNYICSVKNSDRVLRVTATNREGSAIHAFEYVNLNEKFDLAGNQGQAAFVGGRLTRAEINSYGKQSLSILRLVFDDGFVNLAASR